MSGERCAWLEQLAAHALGALGAAEREAVEAHLRTPCAECAAELGRVRADLDALAASPAPVAPRRGLRRRLVAAVRALRRAGKGAGGGAE